MSSFFTIPGAQKKRKRTVSTDVPKKKPYTQKSNGRPEGGSSSSSKNTKTKTKNTSKRTVPPSKKRQERKKPKSPENGSDSDDEDEDEEDTDEDDNEAGSDLASDESEEDDDDDDESEQETAAEKRLRLAERYLENVKQHVDEAGFDAADIDRDLIAQRLQEDVAESKGRVYRRLGPELAWTRSSQTFFRTNTHAVTAVAACAPYVYTATKDLFLHKWRVQDLPADQYPPKTTTTTTRRRRKPGSKAPAPPRTRPALETWVRGNTKKAKERYYKRHTGRILTVAASPDGRYVVTGGEDKKLIVYEAATLRPVKVLTHHRDAVTGLAFRRGTNQLFSCSRDRTVKVWSLDEMAYIETLFGHQDDVVDIDALAQERCVSVGARDRTARLWKVAEETQLVFRGGGGGPDKKKKSKPARYPDVDERSLLAEGTMDRIAMIDDDLFVTGGDNGSLSLWSASKKKPVFVEPLAHGVDPRLDPAAVSAEQNPSEAHIPAPTPRWITALRTVPYSDVILSGSWDGCIAVWCLSDDKRSIERLGTLGGSTSAGEEQQQQQQQQQHDDEKEAKEGGEEAAKDGGNNPASRQAPPQRRIDGLINDITVFERGDRGVDGLCVVAAVSSEHRLGRWKVRKGARNGGVVFEIPRLPRTQTAATATANGEEEKEEKEEDAGLNGA